MNAYEKRSSCDVLRKAREPNVAHVAASVSVGFRSCLASSFHNTRHTARMDPDAPIKVNNNLKPAEFLRAEAELVLDEVPSD